MTETIERFYAMKKVIRILLPILLVVAILLCTAWYLLVYDRPFTRDMLLSLARQSENRGNHNSAAWFYNLAYSQAGDNDAVAIELAEQYKSVGNFTKAEFTLSNAIADGGGIDLYIALCKTYVQQDKLLDAVTMLDNITNEQIKQQLSDMRPAAPTVSPEPGFYSQYISVTLESQDGAIYASTDGQYPSVENEPYAQPIQLVDGENTISAITVSENGLVSPLNIVGYTIGGVIEVMEFADPSVEAEVRKLLGVSDDAVLHNNDLWTIKEFTVPADAKSYADIKHMAFLESLTIENGVSEQISYFSSLANLETLKISNTSVSQDELKIIAGLPLLKNLTLQSCGLTGISPLTDAKELVTLDLNNNTIRAINAISGMQKLQELNLQHNAVTDITPLASASALKRLDISYNGLTTISPLSTLAGLTWLDAGTNSITELGQLGDLTGLTYLSINSNQLTSVSEIAECTALTELDISSNQLTDITALSTLINVLYLDFSHNQVTKLPSFPKDCELVTITGSHNLLTSLAPLSGLKNLNNVNMDYNEGISSVKELADCPVLIEVNVYATKVTDVTALTNQSVIVNYNPVQ